MQPLTGFFRNPAMAENKKDENWVLPYWKWVDLTLESYGKCAFEPLEEFSNWLNDTTDGEKELWACACCWLWIPLCLGYSGIVIAIFCLLATIFAFIGFCYHMVCLATCPQHVEHLLSAFFLPKTKISKYT